MDDSVIMCDKVIESYEKDTKAKSYDETKTVPTNFNAKNINCRTQNFFILLAFLLIIIALSIAVCIYCYLIKYQAKYYLIKYRAKQKHLLPFHFTNNESKEIIY